MRYKLIGFESQASAIEAQMKKALQRRIELITAITNLMGNEEIWRDVQITFTRNLPENVVETAQIINSLRGLVSDETLLSQLSFIKDPEEELKKVQAEKAQAIDLYSFAPGNQEEEVKEDEEE